jgi:hypothetical protein
VYIPVGLNMSLERSVGWQIVCSLAWIPVIQGRVSLQYINTSKYNNDKSYYYKYLSNSIEQLNVVSKNNK